MDQFRGGLSILGLLDEIESCPQLFEDCFVHKDEVSYESVASCLHFTANEDEGADRVFQMLQTFIRNSSPDDLDNFLRFVTVQDPQGHVSYQDASQYLVQLQIAYLHQPAFLISNCQTILTAIEILKAQ